MWTQEDFPGADKVPWQLLIRARYVDQIDALVASLVVEQVSRVASVSITQKLTEAAGTAVREAPHEKATANMRLGALGSVADFYDICPPGWPFRWPPRPKGHLDDFSHPMTGPVIEGALELVRSAGSEQLNKTLGSALQEVGQL